MLLDDAGCCWVLLDDVGCCWMMLGVVGCCPICALSYRYGSAEVVSARAAGSDSPVSHKVYVSLPPHPCEFATTSL